MSKYNNVKVKLDGYIFDSKAEAARYRELKLLADNKLIFNLKIHPVYPIDIGDSWDGETHICNYEADFSYSYDEADTHRAVEDVKGQKTDVYKLKKKLYEALHSPPITEVNMAPPRPVIPPKKKTSPRRAVRRGVRG